MFAIKAVPYDRRWTPQRPWWNGSNFSSAEAFAKRFPTREAAEAELGLAMGHTYHNAVVVELNDSERRP